jgi:hypothetical protein
VEYVKVADVTVGDTVELVGLGDGSDDFRNGLLAEAMKKKGDSWEVRFIELFEVPLKCLKKVAHQGGELSRRTQTFLLLILLASVSREAAWEHSGGRSIACRLFGCS